MLCKKAYYLYKLEHKYPPVEYRFNMKCHICVIRLFIYVKIWDQDLPGGLDGKASAYSAGNPGSIPGPERSPGEGNGNPLVFLPGKSHGPRDLVGYSLQGHKGSDLTERLHFLF